MLGRMICELRHRCCCLSASYSVESLDEPTSTNTTYNQMDGEQRTDWKSIYVVTLVAFIGIVYVQCIQPSIWPYLQVLIPGISENFYGIIHSVVSAATVVSAFVAGYVSNKLRDTRMPMLFAKWVAVAACGVYLLVEVMSVEVRRIIFTAFALLVGVSVGSASTYRAYVAMASTEADRSRAVAITALAPALGIFIGPLAQIAFTLLDYPGVSLLFGLHLNLYTAPIYATIVISILGALLLMFCFDGRMRVADEKREVAKEKSEVVADDSVPDTKETNAELGYDLVAVLVCLYIRVVIQVALLSFNTIAIPYSTMIFQWAPSRTVLYISICMVLIGINICLWNGAYIFFDLRRRLPERQAIALAMLCLLTAYLLTYPWPFLGETIPYKDPDNNSSLGCKLEYKWCGTTPRVNMWFFLGSLIAVLGIAIPLSQINIDVLYSKVLGRIKQGTLQALMVVATEGTNILGPLVAAQIYTRTGPTHIWQFEIGFLCVGILVWTLFYRRMIGKTERLARLEITPL